MQILVTRPQYAAQSLCQALEAMAYKPISLPTIEIVKTPHQEALKQAVQSLESYDMAIFTSRAAVAHGMPLIQEYWPELPKALLFAAIGKGSAKALMQAHANIQQVILPETPPYESESLLATEPLQTVQNKNIIIFTGNGGRELLQNTLKDRGAHVRMVETYQRQLPNINIVNQLNNWRDNPANKLDCIIATSQEGLLNLDKLISLEHKPWFKEIPIVVVSLRMFKLAHMLSFRKPILAEGADDVSICALLGKLKEMGSQ